MQESSDLETIFVIYVFAPHILEKLASYKWKCCFSKNERSDVIFQENNTPAHSAKTSKYGLWTSQSRSDFGLAWPEPRTEPRKSIWFHIKRKLIGKHFSTTRQLFEDILIE